LLETARPHPPQICLSNLNTTVEHAVMLARQQVLSKPIKIELHKAPDLPEVEHDSDQIHQVLLNLLLNAVQAVKGAGTVRVEIGSQDGFASVSVSDTGRGISVRSTSPTSSGRSTPRRAMARVWAFLLRVAS
jgi:signal transduction histidine kinase